MLVSERRLPGAFFRVIYVLVVTGLLVMVIVSALRSRSSATGLTAQKGGSQLMCALLSQGTLQTLPEASGLALSQRTPGVLWSLNDSGAPAVVALDLTGKVLGTVRIKDADISNWEDVSVARCDNASCLYIADAGNAAGTQRNDLVVYKLHEPLPTDRTTVPLATINVVYPPGEDHEAEAMFIAGGQLFLVTKGHPSWLFRFPRQLPAGSLVELERLGAIPTERFSSSVSRRRRITDAETSPDGKWVALRTNDSLLVYRTSDLVAGQTNHFWQADLRSLGEPQGEGVAISSDGDVYLAGEGGEGSRPGTFAHMKCTMPR